MNTFNQIQIYGPFETIFTLASQIARWPEIFPHYRWVKIIERRGEQIIAEMAARHKGIPLWWKTIQVALPEERRIRYQHIGGITKGMEVEWTFTQVKDVWLVQIHHVFEPSWPLITPWFSEQVIGKLFVQQVANKTLCCIKRIIQDVTGELR